MGENTNTSQDVSHRKFTGLSYLILELPSKAIRMFFKERRVQEALSTVS